MPYGITKKEINIIRARDKVCVYCGKQFDLSRKPGNRKDWSTTEHLNHRADWDSIQSYHKHNKSVVEIITLCCSSCNSSRNNKSLRSWFRTKYCIDKNINYDSVTSVVKKYIDKFEK